MRVPVGAALAACFCLVGAEAGADEFQISIEGAGRFDARFPTASGDPDRPLIIGSVPNNAAGAQTNESSLEFIVLRTSRATPTLMEYCAQGKTFAKIEIGSRTAGGAVYTLYDARFVELRAGGLRVAVGARNARDLRNVARTLREDPVIQIRYACAAFANMATGEKSPPCPQAGKAASEVTMKGKKINQN